MAHFMQQTQRYNTVIARNFRAQKEVLKPTRLRYYLALLVSTKVSEEHVASIFSAEVYSVQIWLRAKCQLPKLANFTFY